MRNDDLLRQAYLDAQRIRQLPDATQQSLRRETDWSDARLRGYQPRPAVLEVR